MTWQLFSPDLPFLNEITVSQSRRGLLEQILPYAPALSALFSLIGIIIAYKIAVKARAISAEQKKIAQDKLDMEIFDKRFAIYSNYQKFFLRVIAPEISSNEYLVTALDIIKVDSLNFVVLFKENDIKLFNYVKKDMIDMLNFRMMHKNIGKLSENEELYKYYMEKCAKCNSGLNSIALLMKYYCPEIANSLPRKQLSTDYPAFHPEPQPTAPEQAQ